MIHPAAMFGHQLTPEQRQRTGMTDGLIRVSVGLEYIQDLMKDFDQAVGLSLDAKNFPTRKTG